jgi:UDP-glucose 4-epimerase
MKYILITGGAGNVGASLANALLKTNEYFVVVVDNLLTGKLINLENIENSNFKFLHCDVNNIFQITAVMTSYRFDYVFHYAAVVGVKRTLDNPVWVLNDIEGIKNILELSKNTGVTRVFYSSSSEVYGEPVTLPQFEDTTPLNSKLPYAIVKNVGEAYLKSYKQEYNLDYTIFRFFNTYGPKQSLDFVVSRFLNLAINNLDITLYGDGMQTRTFCYIDDNNDATINALINNQGINDTINIGNDIEYTIYDLAKLCIRKTNSKSAIIHLPPLPDGDMKRRQPNLDKMKLLLNRPLTGIEEGIEKVLEKSLLINIV